MEQLTTDLGDGVGAEPPAHGGIKAVAGLHEANERHRLKILVREIRAAMKAPRLTPGEVEIVSGHLRLLRAQLESQRSHRHRPSPLCD